MALLERLELVIEADARTAEREFKRIGQQASESLGEIEDAARMVGANAADKLAGNVGEFRAAGEKLSDAAGERLDLSAAASRAAADVPRALEAQRGDAEAAGRRLGDSAAEGVTSGLRSAGGGVRSAGADLGGDAGGGVSDGMLDSLSGITSDLSGVLDGALSALPPGLVGPAGAAAAVVGAAFVQGFADAIESENLGDVVAARVGAGAAESEQFARVSAGVFRDAWGDSTAEVADAVDAVYSTLSDSRGSEAALKDLTTRAQAFAQVFEQDVGEAVSNAGVLIETGLARDAVDAFDLMTAAAQNVPAAMRDELGEATQEYSTFFATLGFDGQEAFGILVDAAGEGRYELDKTGDAIKELSVRATDLDNVAAQSALEELGFDAAAMSTELLKGGESARIATQQIMDALAGVQDPAEQAAIAVALMGAPLEDLNKSEIPQFIDRLAGATDGMEDATGASDDLTNSLKNTQSAFTTVKRELLGGFEDYANDVLQPLADYLNSDDPGLKEAANGAGEFLGNAIVDAMYLTIGGPLSLFFDLPGKDAIKDALGLGEDLPSPEELGVPQLEAGINGLGDTFGTVGGKAAAGAALIAGGFADVAGEAGGAAMSVDELNAVMEVNAEVAKIASERSANYLAVIGDTTSLDNMLTSTLSLTEATRGIGQWVGDLSQSVDISDIADGLQVAAEDTSAVLQKWLDIGTEAQQVIADTLQFQGADQAIARADGIRQSLVGVMEQAGYTDEQIQELLTSMGLTEGQVDIAIEVSGTEEAMAKLEILREFLLAEGGAGIPREINSQIVLALDEGRAEDAANLLSLWVQDSQDGLIENPLLVALGLGDTAPASGEVDGWKAGEEAKPPAKIGVDADTGPARSAAADLFFDIGRLAPIIKVGIEYGGAAGAGAGNAVLSGINRITGAGGGVDQFGIPLYGRRATGGPAMAGAAYGVNEVGAEMFVPSTSGFVMDHSESAALVEGVRQLVAGGGSGVNVTQTIVTADPVVAGSESARKMRDAAFLAGV